MVLTQDEGKGSCALSGYHLDDGHLALWCRPASLECLRLRVKDVDFTYHPIVVRDGKGRKDRVTMLPQHAKAPLRRHLHDNQRLHAQDVQAGAGHIYLP